MMGQGDAIHSKAARQAIPIPPARRIRIVAEPKREVEIAHIFILEVLKTLGLSPDKKTQPQELFARINCQPPNGPF